MREATAAAGSNIALVKYWGKLDCAGNLPATSSISMTLDGMKTETTVRFDGSLPADAVTMNGAPADQRTAVRVSELLDRVRSLSGIEEKAAVRTRNSFPTASGLASSASGFAALAVAAAGAAGLDLDLDDLAALARSGSGSAPRSLIGGFAELERGDADRPGRCRVTEIAGKDDWDLRMVVAAAGAGPKDVGSTEGMERSRKTSPYYGGWIESHAGDIEAARRAIQERDLRTLGEVAERSCLKMHALMLASQPPLIYWKGATVMAMNMVRELRASGVEGYFTIDAGPHVKVLCAPRDAAVIATALAGVPGMARTVIEKPGKGASLI